MDKKELGLSVDVNDIGPGYRNITTGKYNDEMCIFLYGYSKATKKPKDFVIPFRPEVLYRVKYETPIKDIFNNSLERKEFPNSFERYKWLQNKGNIHVVQAYRVEEDFLHKQFTDIALESTFNTQPLKIHFLDIENEVSESFEKPTSAGNRINLITIYDSQLKKYFSWALTNVQNTFKDKDKYEIFNFDNDEARMLRHFCNWFSLNIPDVITGWNTFFYDIPYLYHRILNVLGDSWVKRLSPVGKCKVRQSKPSKGAPVTDIQTSIAIDGVSQLDLLILYRDKFKVKANLDGGYNLSNVGEAEGLGRKMEYDGSIKDFYLRDFQRFYEYNVRDVELTVHLEEKLKLIGLARKITSSGLSLYESIYASVGYISGCIAVFAETHHKKIFPTYMNAKNEPQAYEGAYVFPCQAGLYKNGIATVDFASLYPNTMISVNLSPETYVGKILEDYSPEDSNDTQYHVKNRNGNVVIISKDKLEKLLETKCIITKNNTLFIKHELQWGVVAAWCKHFYMKRKEVKKEMFKLEKDIYDHKVKKADMEEVETHITNLNNTQMMLKTMINSCYGLFGTAFSPFYNPDLAQTITRQGRFANTSAAAFIRNKFMEKYGIDNEYVITISGDTDTLASGDTVYIKRIN